MNNQLPLQTNQVVYLVQRKSKLLFAYLTRVEGDRVFYKLTPRLHAPEKSTNRALFEAWVKRGVEQFLAIKVRAVRCQLKSEKYRDDSWDDEIDFWKIDEDWCYSDRSTASSLAWRVTREKDKKQWEAENERWRQFLQGNNLLPVESLLLYEEFYSRYDNTVDVDFALKDNINRQEAEAVIERLAPESLWMIYTDWQESSYGFSIKDFERKRLKELTTDKEFQACFKDVKTCLSFGYHVWPDYRICYKCDAPFVSSGGMAVCKDCAAKISAESECECCGGSCGVDK